MTSIRHIIKYFQEWTSDGHGFVFSSFLYTGWDTEFRTFLSSLFGLRSFATFMFYKVWFFRCSSCAYVANPNQNKMGNGFGIWCTTPSIFTAGFPSDLTGEIPCMLGIVQNFQRILKSYREFPSYFDVVPKFGGDELHRPPVVTLNTRSVICYTPRVIITGGGVYPKN